MNLQISCRNKIAIPSGLYLATLIKRNYSQTNFSTSFGEFFVILAKINPAKTRQILNLLKFYPRQIFQNHDSLN